MASVRPSTQPTPRDRTYPVTAPNITEARVLYRRSMARSPPPRPPDRLLSRTPHALRFGDLLGSRPERRAPNARPITRVPNHAASRHRTPVGGHPRNRRRRQRLAMTMRSPNMTHSRPCFPSAPGPLWPVLVQGVGVSGRVAGRRWPRLAGGGWVGCETERCDSLAAVRRRGADDPGDGDAEVLQEALLAAWRGLTVSGSDPRCGPDCTALPPTAASTPCAAVVAGQPYYSP